MAHEPPPAEKPADKDKPPPGMVPVQFEHTGNFADLLQQIGATLLITTYQAGKLVVVGTHLGKLSFSFHNYEQAMGLAVQRSKLAIGTKRQVWVLRAAPELGPKVDPPGKHDACYLTRTAYFTGEIHGHEMAWVGDELWICNTLFSCICTLHEEYSFVPRWKPPFITQIAAEDRCHLNGMTMENGRPRYVTLLAETDTPAGWRPTKATTGCVMDVARNEVVARGFSMCHSPRLFNGKLWVLDSGKGQLRTVDAATGRHEEVAGCQGFTRGLAFFGPFAFVGLSKIRETNVFGGLPIAEKREQLKCGVEVVDWRSGRIVAGLAFHTGVDEIFDVQVLPGIRCPVVSGLTPTQDGSQPIWLAPPPDRPLPGLRPL